MRIEKPYQTVKSKKLHWLNIYGRDIAINLQYYKYLNWHLKQSIIGGSYFKNWISTIRASGISHYRGPAKFGKIREIPRYWQKSAESHEIHQDLGLSRLNRDDWTLCSALLFHKLGSSACCHWTAENVDHILEFGKKINLDSLQEGLIPDTETLSLSNLPFAIHWIAESSKAVNLLRHWGPILPQKSCKIGIKSPAKSANFTTKLTLKILRNLSFFSAKYQKACTMHHSTLYRYLTSVFLIFQMQAGKRLKRRGEGRWGGSL